MFCCLFSCFFLGKQKKQADQQALKEQGEHHQPFGPFSSGRRSLVEKSPLIKHTKAKATSDETRKSQNHDRANIDSENQAFLKDVRINIEI